MSNLEHKLIEALSTHAGKVAMSEVEDDFPLLRLNKSVHAYLTIATFMTIPPEQRIEVAVACAMRRTPEQMALWEAFRNRMEPCKLAQLRQMATRPTPLEAGGPRGIPVGDDFVIADLRRRQDGLTKAEIRRCFMSRLREGYGDKLRPSGKSTVLYESVRPVGDWRLVTCLDFGGWCQFRCDFRLKHEEIEGYSLYSLGYVLGFGGASWDDVRRATLEADADKALRLCQALRSFFSNVLAEL